METQEKPQKVFILLTETDYLLGVFSAREYILPSLKTYFPTDKFNLIEETDASIRFTLNDCDRKIAYIVVEQEVLTKVTEF